MNSDPNRIGQLEFGIAIHVGQVAVGNISSDTCIDYTVIGPNVNLVARLEEATKASSFKKNVGVGGILFSASAEADLRYYCRMPRKRHQLHQLGMQIRSFPQVSEIFYMEAATAINAASMHDPAPTSKEQEPAA